MRRSENSKPSATVAPPAEPLPSSAANAELKRPPKQRDGLVLACIGIVSAALAVMLSTQFGLSMSLSALAGAIAWAGFMLVHKQVQKSAQIAQLKAELARAKGQNPGRRMLPQRGGPVAPPEPSDISAVEARLPEFGAAAHSSLSLPQAPAAGPAELSVSGDASFQQPTFGPPMQQPISAAPAGGRDAPTDGLARQVGRRDGVGSTAGEFGQTPFRADSAPHDLASSTFAAPPAGAQPKEPQSLPEMMRDQWSFRPRAAARSAHPDGTNGGYDAAASMSAPALTIESDLELVQRKIKELADEVNAGGALRSARPPHPDAVSKSTAAAIEDSIGALKAAAGTMRNQRSHDFVPSLDIPAAVKLPGQSAGAALGFGELIIPSSAERIAGSDPEPLAIDPASRIEPRLDLPPPDFPLVDFPPGPTLPMGEPSGQGSIAQAVRDGAVDVMLAPIVTLTTHTVGHYEMTAVLHSADGQAFEAVEDTIARLGGETGAQFDVLRLDRAVALAQRMEANDRDGVLLTRFSGAALANGDFLSKFAQAYEARPHIAAQLVPTISQSSVTALGSGARQAIRDMHAFGFQFAIDDLQHVSTDFAALAGTGFRFVKVNARLLLDGIAMSDRFVTTEEILQRAALAGLSVIATGVDDAKIQARLLEAGVVLGQGALFGIARKVNLSEGPPSSGRSAAA